MRVVVSSTIYPSVLPFVRPWYESVERQNGAKFTLHLALDGVAPEEVEAAADTPIVAEYTHVPPGETPATVRQKAWDWVCERFDAVILVDADDMMHPTRVAASIAGLEAADVYGCALSLVGPAGEQLGKTLGAREVVNWPETLLCQNVFGLSNTAYRTAFIRAALPLPADVQAVDWYLVTQAVAAGATLAFDNVPRMLYRQHGNNIGRVLPPFDAESLRLAIKIVLVHLRRTLESWPTHNPAPGRRRIEMRTQKVMEFAEALNDSETRRSYLAAINAPRQEVYAWWQMIAMPELEWIWNP